MNSENSFQSDYIRRQNIWYLNPMVWFAIGLPTLVVIASMLTIVIAVNNAPRVIDSKEPSSTIEQASLGEHS